MYVPYGVKDSEMHWLEVHVKFDFWALIQYEKCCIKLQLLASGSFAILSSEELI